MPMRKAWISATTPAGLLFVAHAVCALRVDVGGTRPSTVAAVPTSPSASCTGGQHCRGEGDGRMEQRRRGCRAREKDETRVGHCSDGPGVRCPSCRHHLSVRVGMPRLLPGSYGGARRGSTAHPRQQ
eukprot:scaffold13535_cov114-Isochrysis_galbana.AAC.3